MLFMKSHMERKNQKVENKHGLMKCVFVYVRFLQEKVQGSVEGQSVHVFLWFLSSSSLAVLLTQVKHKDQHKHHNKHTFRFSNSCDYESNE